LREHDEWRFLPSLLLRALRAARAYTSVAPELDTFATAGNEHFALFLDVARSALLRDIAGWASYCNPPFELWPVVAQWLLAAKERDATTSCLFVIPEYAKAKCQRLIDASVSLLVVPKGTEGFTQYEQGSPLFDSPATLRWDVDVRLLLPSSGLTPAGAALHRKHFPEVPVSRRQPRHLSAFRASLEWFRRALATDSLFRSKYFLPDAPVEHVHVFTDASGVDGWGGHCQGWQFGRAWRPHELHYDITTLEAMAVEEAIECLSSRINLGGKIVTSHVDNVGVVFGLNAGRSRLAGIHAILGKLFSLSASLEFFSVASWIPRGSNTYADSLSHRYASWRTRCERVPGAALHDGDSDGRP
jgi:hypothetical protein